MLPLYASSAHPEPYFLYHPKCSLDWAGTKLSGPLYWAVLCCAVESCAVAYNLDQCELLTGRNVF